MLECCASKDDDQWYHYNESFDNSPNTMSIEYFQYVYVCALGILHYLRLRS